MLKIIPLFVFLMSITVQESEPIDPAVCAGHKDDSSCICPELAKEYPGPACMPVFEGRISEISIPYKMMMNGRSMHENCPVPLEDLRLLTFTHWGYDGKIHDGQIIVAKVVSEEVLNIFKELYAVRFPIEKARLIDYYNGNDLASMKDNNSSSFNCRVVMGSKKWSEHSYGQAIDLNPLTNPFVTKNSIEPATAVEYIDRTKRKPGMILADDPVVKIFQKYGWTWGGSWKTSKDYQHFSKSGR